MKRMRRRCWLLVAALGALVGGCEGAEDERPDLDSIGGKADAPGWFKQVSADWGCGDSVDGAFKGTDSAHLYTFELKQGTAYSFELSASYPPAKGAAVAIYEQSSGKRVAYDREPGRTEATVSYTPAKSGTHLVGVYSVAWTADGDYSLRAVCQPAGFNQLQIGQTSYTTLERKQQFWRAGVGPELKSAVDAAAPSGRSGDVEEADIYKIAGSRLYLFNTYRGFMIFDISDAKQPKLISRLPVFGYPVEMFVQNSTIYALVRDALYLTQEQGALRFKRHNVSQLVAISIASEAQPKVLSTTDIVGELREGVSRKIGDTIYVVSNVPQYYSWGWRRDAAPEQKEQAWVYSFNVADPKSAKLVEKLQLFEGGSYSTSDGQSSESRSFNNLAISATADALMVVENWYKYGYVAGAAYSCGTSTSLQQAVVSIVDISSPTGKIKLHTKLETYGELGDQFKQTYFVDKSTGKATYLGIFARREWSSTDCKGQSFTANNLEAWDVSVAGKPVKLATLPFGKPNETVRGSVFDSDRRVAFAITAEQIDPLYALSFADPKQPKVLSAVNGLSGDMNLFRFIADKKFILAVGRDSSATCTGFGAPATGWASNVAVSIIDVQDLAKIRLVQRRCVTVNDASWIGSEVNWNLDQAHKMIGMHSDGLVNLVTVPVYYSKKTSSGSDWWYSQETGVGVMGWDLTKYDPSKSELDQKVLETHATVVHPQGQVRRSVVFTHQGATSRRKMLNLSNTHLALVDIEDLAKPAADAVVEVAPYRAALLRFGAYIVEQVSPGWESGGNEQKTEFRVKKAGAGLDSAPVVASFGVAGVSQALKHKDALVVLRHVEVAGTWQPEALIYDLSAPTAPKLAGSTKLPLAWIPYVARRLDVAGYWSGDGRGVAQTDRGLVFLKNEWDDKAQAEKSSLVFLELIALSKPAVSESPLAAGAQRAYVELLRDGSGKGFFVTYRELLGEELLEGTTFEKVKYFAQPWSFVSSWKGGTALNVPGRPMDAWTGSGLPLLLVRDSSFELTKDGAWKESERLNLALRAYSKAMLFDTTRLTGLRIDSAMREGGRLYLVAGERRDFYPMPMMKMIPYSASAADRLMIIDVGAAILDRLFAQEIGTESASLLAVQQGRLFLGIAGDGVLVINAMNASKPSGQQFLRTLEQPGAVELVGNTAYVPAGYYGVYQLDVTKSAQLPLE